MPASRSSTTGPCILDGIEPLLTELQHPVSLQVAGREHPERAAAERFVQAVFARMYGADVSAFYPTLLAFSRLETLHGVVGYRPAAGTALFAEQYLDQPLEWQIAAHWDETVDRRQIVEVGNLALAGPGHARWVIAAVTAYLHARGFRWVMFTAVAPLINAFRRLGLRPVVLAPADPARLADDGQRWGTYYTARPSVCVGDIGAGYRKLSSGAPLHQPKLQALLAQARRQAGAVDDVAHESAPHRVASDR